MLLTVLYVYFNSDDSTKEEAVLQKVAPGMNAGYTFVSAIMTYILHI